MPLTISGMTFVTTADVVEWVTTSRQTLWRGRQEWRIPVDHRFRKRHVVFTPAEVKEIERFANRIDPFDPPTDPQPDLSHGA